MKKQFNKLMHSWHWLNEHNVRYYSEEYNFVKKKICKQIGKM